MKSSFCCHRVSRSARGENLKHFSDIIRACEQPWDFTYLCAFAAFQICKHMLELYKATIDILLSSKTFVFKFIVFSQLLSTKLTTKLINCLFGVLVVLNIHALGKTAFEETFCIGRALYQVKYRYSCKWSLPKKDPQYQTGHIIIIITEWDFEGIPILFYSWWLPDCWCSPQCGMLFFKATMDQRRERFVQIETPESSYFLLSLGCFL